MADSEPTGEAASEVPIPNEAVQWSDFDAHEYYKINYAEVLPEDVEIIECASKFLIEACGSPSRPRRAVDVGAGTNLYPSLLMLPWAEHIVFTEYAPGNIDWLRQNLAYAPGRWHWQSFWDLIGDLPGYRTIDDPRRRLADAHEIRRQSIFDLPEQAWDLGSMFFVADGMTTVQHEFETAVRTFLAALRPGSPFLMAFMEGSRGYEVHDKPFPSVNITPGSLEALLARLPVSGASVLRTDNSVRPLRRGYDAMLLVTGFAAMELRWGVSPRWRE